jgi:hypothetical protein
MTTPISISINPANSNVSLQLLNPSYDTFYRALATSIFAQHTGFNLGFGCNQYNPLPHEDYVIGYHNFVNHKIQVGLAKWLRMYVGGSALGQLPTSFDSMLEDGDFSELKNDGKNLPSVTALLNFFGEMYSAHLASDFGKIHLPEDLILKFNEFLQPPMSRVSWVHHTKTWDDSKNYKYANEFLKSNNSLLCVFTPDPSSEKISFNFFNSTSSYSGMVPPPPDIDRYHEKSGGVQIKLTSSINSIFRGSNSIGKESDCLEKCHCLLKTRHNLDNKVCDGYHVIFPLIYNHVDMELRRRYRDITRELIKNLPKTLQSKIMINYADIELLSKSSSSSGSSVRPTSSSGSSSVRPTSSSSSSSVRPTSSSSSSSVRPTSSSSSFSGSLKSSSAAFSDDDNDGEDDSVEKKRSMDNLVKDAFKLGNHRHENRQQEPSTAKQEPSTAKQEPSTAKPSQVYKFLNKGEYSSSGEELDDDYKIESILNKQNSVRDDSSVRGSVRGSVRDDGSGSVRDGGSIYKSKNYMSDTSDDNEYED